MLPGYDLCMGVDAVHKQYSDYTNRWAKCRDAMEGEEAVKGGRERYLPRLDGMLVPEYDAYLKRSLYVNASGRTKDAYVGLIFGKDVEVSCPLEIKDIVDSFEDDFTRQHLSLFGAAKDTVREVLTVGRGGWLVDVAPGAGPRAHGAAVFYSAEGVTNWRTEDRNGVDTLTCVVLREAYNLGTGDEFCPDTLFRYRVLRLTTEGVYTQQVYLPTKQNGELEWVGGDIITPTRQGEPLHEIPFVFVGPNNVTASVDRPPLEDLVDVNLSHFRTSADLENGRHWCGVPTPVFVGFKFQPGQELKVGSSGGIQTDDTNAKWGFLEFTGAGLSTLVEASKEKREYMAAMDARLLRDEQKLQNETAEAARIRSTGESATLSSISSTVSEALTLVLQWLVWWAGVEDVSKVEVCLNTQFVDVGLDAQKMVALISARQSGLISQESFLWNLKRGNLLDPSVSVEQEMERIDSAPPSGQVSNLSEADDAPNIGPGAKKEDAPSTGDAPRGSTPGEVPTGKAQQYVEL